MRTVILGLACLFLGVQPLAAQNSLASPIQPLSCGPRILVTYEDAFPDFFTIYNLSPAGWTLESLSIDVSHSYGEAIFDTEPGAIGRDTVNGYFAARADARIRLTSVTPRADQREISLRFDGFAPSRSFAFLIDMDDTAPVSSRGPERVTFGEMWDTRVIAAMQGPTGYPVAVEARFGQTGVADSGLGGCASASLPQPETRN